MSLNSSSVIFIIHEVTGSLACVSLFDVDLESGQAGCQTCILAFFTDCQGKLIIRNNNFALFSSASAITEITLPGLNAFSRA